MTDKEKLDKLKKLADAMYYAAQHLTTDASRLHKAMDEYHKFIIHECKDDSVSEKWIEELRTKLNSMSKEDFKKVFDKYAIDFDEEPVSEELEEAAENYAVTDEVLPNGKVMINFQVEKAFRAGANWQHKQLEKNRLKHCDNITNEQAELEQNFIDQHLDKYNRMPTFLDAIEYGMNLQKEQLLAKAFDFTKEHNTACVLASECLRNHGWFNRERDFNDLFRHLSCVDKLFEGKFGGKTKVIVIKEN